MDARTCEHEPLVTVERASPFLGSAYPSRRRVTYVPA